MELTNIEVKFSKDYLADRPKKEAYIQFRENNHRANVIAGMVPLDGVEYEKLRVTLPPVTLTPELADFEDLGNHFYDGLYAMQQGDRDSAARIGEAHQLLDYASPQIAYLDTRIEGTRQKALESRVLLPWTSADNITIFPLT